MAKKRAGQQSDNKIKKQKTLNVLAFVMIFLVIVLIVLIIFLFVEIGFIENPFHTIRIRTQEFQIKDECSMIVGNLIHSIQDEGVCQQKCKTECGVRDLYFYSSEFAESEADCHSCKCFCR